MRSWGGILQFLREKGLGWAVLAVVPTVTLRVSRKGQAEARVWVSCERQSFEAAVERQE